LPIIVFKGYYTNTYGSDQTRNDVCIKTIRIKSNLRNAAIKQAKYPLLLRNSKFVLQPVEVLEFKLDDWNLLIVLVYPFLKDSLFDRQFTQKKPLSTAQFIELFEFGCEVMLELERKHLTHLDVKPSNIMLERDPNDPRKMNPRLTDFGISHQTQT